MKKEQTPETTIISRNPLTGSKKIYVHGELHDIQVAMRQIELSPTEHKLKNDVSSTRNEAVTVYDTSGPYTDPNIAIDLKKGLNRMREQWILKRGDVEQLNDFSSAYCRERLATKSLDAFRFEHFKKPLRAKPGCNV